MKKHAKLIAAVALCLLPMLLVAAEYHRLPDQVVIHFNSAGEADGYAPKGVLFLLPVLMAALQVLCTFAGKFDKRAETAAASLYWFMQWLMPVLSCLLMALCVYASLGVALPVTLIMQLLLGVVTMILGNYMPKCRQNSIIGVKLPWTLKDPENWNFTHRVTGYVWFICGILMLTSAFINAIWLTCAVLIIMVIVPFAASLYFKVSHK